jgi:adenylate kinase
MKILIIGPIGSGKTTQGVILTKELNLPHIQTGQLIRDKAQGDDAFSQELKKDMSQGILISDQLMSQLFQEAVSKIGQSGFISDSYPRRLSQLPVYDPMIDIAIYLQVPDEIIEKRLLARKRADDTPEIIKKRLHVYHSETAPLLDYYREQNKLITADNPGDPAAVAQQIMEKLKEKNL